jgi:hypothetical protein
MTLLLYNRLHPSAAKSLFYAKFLMAFGGSEMGQEAA